MHSFFLPEVRRRRAREQASSCVGKDRVSVCACRVSPADEAAELLRSLRRTGESRKAFHRRMSVELRWRFSRVREIDYRRARLRPEELDQLRRHAQQGNGDARARLHRLLAEVRGQLERIERRI